MGRPSTGYLHRNRHGTFSFRWRPPSDLTARFDQRIYVLSLHTKCRDRASHRARLPAYRLTCLVGVLRMNGTDKDELVTAELIRRLVLPGGQITEVDYDPSNPAEVAEAKRIFEDMMRGQHLTAPEADLLEWVLVVPPETKPQVHGPIISEAFKRFCAARRAANAWKDPAMARRQREVRAARRHIG